jgi:hypothetical protein
MARRKRRHPRKAVRRTVKRRKVVRRKRRSLFGHFLHSL